MNPAIRLRPLSEADLGFADALRAGVGWNQTLNDWRRFLRMDPNGCFVAEWNGTLAGTATTTLYRTDLAWIGMVLVEPASRKRGIGRALLEHCIEYLTKAGVRCIKLDATPLGKPVYEALGFETEWTLTRWECPDNTPKPAATSAALRDWQESDARSVTALDTEAFGVSRQHLLSELSVQCRCALVSEEQPGYGMMRTGSRANYLGPVTTRSPEVARGLVTGLMASGGSEPVYWDIPDLNEHAREWAENWGFTRQRTLTRMFRGENSAAGNPRMQFALAGPELG
jgi:GNAT superfamily N-acetyltransferase